VAMDIEKPVKGTNPIIGYLKIYFQDN